MLAVTYTRRHRTLQDVSKRSLPSSPLEDLSPTRDLTLSEMSRRMKKRTRLVLSESHDNMIQKHPMEPFFKKSKTSGSQRDRSVETLILPSTPITLERPLLPLATQQIYDSIFETPESSADTAIKASEIPDQLSPIPLARRMLSRTSSRNFKENSGKNSRTGLASPFNSRPTSRASSPLRIANSNRRPISHVKARTLSTNLPRLKDVTASIGPLSTDAEKDSILASSVAVSAPMSASHTLHSRAASIPAMNSALFNSITLENWLVPPKVLSRSPTVSPDDLQLDTFQVEHASFYFDVPTKVSTPPRKRSTTITQRSFRNREDSEGFEMSQPNKDDDVAMSDDGIVPQQSRRRRRTVVHMSSDSIFSSALDFSAYTSDDYQTARREVPVVDPTDILDSASNVHNAGSILDSAFSPASTRKGASQFVPVEEICSTAPSSPESAPRKALPSSVVLPTSHLHHLLSRRSQSLPIKPDADTNELNDMFTMLGLEGTYMTLHICVQTNLRTRRLQNSRNQIYLVRTLTLQSQAASQYKMKLLVWVAPQSTSTSGDAAIPFAHLTSRALLCRLRVVQSLARALPQLDQKLHQVPAVFVLGP